MDANPHPNRRRLGLAVALIASLTAAAIGLYMAASHLEKPTGGLYEAVCNPNADLFGLPADCDRVNSSRYAEFLGIPLGILGAGVYLALALLSILSLGRDEERSGDARAMLAAGAFACILYSIGLLYLQVKVLEAFCPFCVSLYVLHLVIFLGALASLNFSIGPASERFVRIATRFYRERTFLAPAATFVLAVLIGQTVYVSAQTEAMVDSSKPGVPITPEELAEILKNTEKVERVSHPNDAAKGPKRAPYEIIEFSDFLCPFCRKADQSIGTLAENHSSKVRLVFKHFPLDTACNDQIGFNMHPGACKMAQAAVCAQSFDLFWPYHDALFEKGKQIAQGDVEKNLIDLARRLGMEPAAFAGCLNDSASLAQVKADIAKGAEIGIQGTPAFLFNDWPFYRPPLQAGARAAERFRSLIEKDLATQ